MLDEHALDAYIDKVRAEWKNVGVAVAVIAGSELVYARGFGIRQCHRAERIDADTLFQIGSTTKAFTAAAVGVLVDEQRVGWDDPVIQYWPGFRLQDPWLTRHLTLCDVLAHRSGTSDRSASNFYPFLGVNDAEETFAQAGRLACDGRFRDSYRYSNLLYAVAGKLIETVSGMTWAEWLRSRILQPLRMNRTSTSAYEVWPAQSVTAAFFGSTPGGWVSLEDAIDPNVALPHSWDESGALTALPWQNYDNAAAAGSLVSSVSDLSRWLIMNVSEGQFEGRSLLRSETLRTLHATHNMSLDAGSTCPFLEKTETYALGWRRGRYRSHVHLAHGGGIIGFPAYIALLPECGHGVVVLSNGSQYARDRQGLYRSSFHKSLAFWIFDRLLKVPVRDWSCELLSRTQAADRPARNREEALRRGRVPDSGPSLPLAHYAGIYEDQAGHSGPVEVRVDAGCLTLTFRGEGSYAGSLEHWHFDIFRLHSNPGVEDIIGAQFPFVTFTLGPCGQVVAMRAFDSWFERL